jgi:hypothetical protein
VQAVNAARFTNPSCFGHSARAWFRDRAGAEFATPCTSSANHDAATEKAMPQRDVGSGRIESYPNRMFIILSMIAAGLLCGKVSESLIKRSFSHHSCLPTIPC